jgi:hypothetical protein
LVAEIIFNSKLGLSKTGRTAAQTLSVVYLNSQAWIKPEAKD